MESVQHIRKTDLARRTRQVFEAVRAGQTVIIETEGHAEAALVDIIDYRLLRAMLHFYAQPPPIERDAGLLEATVAAQPDVQARYHLVMAHYLSASISLARAAALLGLTPVDLCRRFHRLDVPLRTAPADLAEALRDVETALKFDPGSGRRGQ